MHANCNIAVPEPPSQFAVDLGRSLQVQALSAAGRLIRACLTHSFPDVMDTWTELLKVCGIAPTPTTLDLHGKADWHRINQLVLLALQECNGFEASIRWANADLVIRAFASQSAACWWQESEKLRGGDHWDDIDSERRAEIEHALSQASKLRAFAEGR